MWAKLRVKNDFKALLKAPFVKLQKKVLYESLNRAAVTETDSHMHALSNEY